MVILFFNILRNCPTVFNRSGTIGTNSTQASSFPHPLKHLLIYVFSIVVIIIGVRMVSHCIFDLHFPND